MAIELKIGARGTREDFEDTYTRSFLEDNGLLKFDPRKFEFKYHMDFYHFQKYPLLLL